MITLLNNIFPLHKETLIVEEKFTSFQLKYDTDLSKVNIIHNLADNLKSIDDKWILNILIQNHDNPIQLDSTENQTLNKFQTELIEALEDIEDESITLEFKINKKPKKDGHLTIYDVSSFFSFIEKIDTLTFLDLIKNPLDLNLYLFFTPFSKQETIPTFFSHSIYFNCKESQIQQGEIKEISDNCYFLNKDDYPFSPANFHILYQDPKQNNPLIDKLNKLAILFSVISLADYSSIEKDILHYKIIGYKSIQGSINYESSSINALNIYHKIYEWVYSEKGSITDKLGLSRNILSIYIKENNLDVDEDVIFSIQSGYKTYIQDNLDKYLDIRSKLTDQLEVIHQKANSTIESVIANYQKSNFAFISFFISIFVLRVLSKGDFENVFTKDATIISLALLGLSVLYLFYSLWIFRSERNRLKKRYENLKNRFSDLLVEEDINKILRNNEEFDSEIDFINKKKCHYTILWAITIIIFLCAIFSTSSFFGWTEILNFFSGQRQ